MSAKLMIIISFLVLISGSSHANFTDEKKSYLWNIDGGVLYQKPYLNATVVGTISYGDALLVLEALPNHSVEVTVFSTENKNLPTNEYLHEYLLNSQWLKVSNGVDIGYIPDTFLIPLPPPNFSDDLHFNTIDYLRNLSKIGTEHAEKQNNLFCERLRLEFENNMQYSYTDFGPCEQCGHSQEKIIFPKLNGTDGLIMALTFFRLQAFDLNKNVYLKGETTGWQIEGYLDYGQHQLIIISNQELGLLMKINYYM